MADWLRTTPAFAGQHMPGSPEYRVCRRCVMDTTLVEIEFVDQGVCNFCRGYDHHIGSRQVPEAEKARRLEAILEQVRRDGRGRDYECVLGLSGGVDSSYLALRCKEWGIRPLLVQFDNGWNTELANHNIQAVCEKLQFDLLTYVVDWPEFRDLQLSFLKAGLANLEAPSDHGIFACIYRTTREKNIRWLLSGVNWATEACCPIGEKVNRHFAYGYRYADLVHLKDVHRRFGTVPLKTFPTLGLVGRMWIERAGRVQRCDPLNYLPYDKKAAIHELESRLGWRPYTGKHFESVITRFHQSYILPRKFGVDKRRLHLSGLVWSGQGGREEALAELGRPPCPAELLEQDRTFVIKKLGLTEREFEGLMAEPARTYEDYRHINGIYNRLPGFLRSVRRLLGRSRAA